MKKRLSSVRAYCIIMMVLILSVWSLLSAELGDDSTAASESFTIIFKHFGRDPKNIEKTITIPLETRLRNVRGLEKISSRSELGSARLYLYMKADYNYEEAYIDIRDAVYGLYSGLPSSVQKPQIHSGNNLKQPEIIFALNSSTYSKAELQDIAEKNIKPALENIKEAGEIQIGGGALTEILVHIDRKKALSKGITSQSLGKQISNSYVHNSVNNMISGSRYYSILFKGRLNSSKELSNIFVKNNEGKQFLLSEIARVEKTKKVPETISRLNGEQKLIFYVKSSGRGSIISLSGKLKEKLAKWENTGVEFETIIDKGDILKKAIASLLRNIIISVGVVSFFIIIGLKKIRIALPVALGLPYNAIISLAIFNIANLTIGLSSLLGIGLAIGVVADSGIIIAYYMVNESGEKNSLSKEIKLSLVSSAITTVIVTAPLLLSTQIALDAKRIALSFFVFIIVSTITNMVLLPAIIPASKKDVNFILANIFERFEKLIYQALKMPIKRIVIISLFLFLLFIFGIAFTPRKIDSTLHDDSLSVHIELDGGASLNYVDSQLTSFTTKLENVDGVTELESFARRENGTVSVKYDKNIISKKMLTELIESYNDLFREASIIVLKESSKDELNIPIRIQGADVETLKNIIDRLSDRFKEEDWIKNIVYHFKDGGPVLSFSSTEQARSLNFTPEMINGIVHWAVQGPVSMKWLAESDEYDLRIVSSKDNNQSLEDVKNLIVSNGKTNTPLSELVVFSETNDNTAIFRNNLQRSLEFSVIANAGNVNNTFRQLENALADVSMPTGYRYKIDDSILKKKHEFKILMYLVVAAIVLVYIVLSSVFESLFIPLLIILNIPLSLAPCFIVINLFGLPFTSRVFVGFIIVTGIIVNNSILITEKSLSIGLDEDYFGNVFCSVRQRFESLFMTTASTCVGLLPIIFSFTQSDSIKNLALVIFFGVFFSFIFGVFLYPAILLYFLESKNMEKKSINKPKGALYET